MSKICSSRNLFSLEVINNGLKKNMLFLELAYDRCFANYAVNDTIDVFAQDLLLDALHSMKSFVILASDFEDCLRAEKDINF